MGKKEAAVIKKGLTVLILFTFIFLAAGCETVKGAFEGAKKDWQSAKKFDDWMRKNMW